MDCKNIESKDLAKYIIDFLYERKSFISNIRLQSFLYVIQKSFINRYGCSVFSDNIIAAKFGPMIENVYYEYSSFAAYDIFDTDDDNMFITIFKDKYKNKDIDFKYLDSLILNLYSLGQKDTFLYLDKYQNKNGVWAKAVDRKSKIIKAEDMINEVF